MARDRIREITARERLLLWPELIVEDLNKLSCAAGRVLPPTGHRLSCSARSGITNRTWNGSRYGLSKKGNRAGAPWGWGIKTGAG